MRSTLILLFGICLSVLFITCTNPATEIENDYSIIPLPEKITKKTGQFLINAQTKILIKGTDSNLEKVANLAAEYILTQTGLTLATSKDSDSSPAITLELDESLSKEEGYQLSINPEQVSIKSQTAAGVFYGVQSLRQLVSKDEKSGKIYLPCGEINDAPRYGYRGIMLDVARHFFPVDFIKKYIDLLAYHKINRFHWHLTEDQGWRIEIKKYPKLTEISAFRKETIDGHYSDKPRKYDGKRHGGFYTQEEIKEIVAYAEERFITIIPEIEMPGHSQAAIAAYPELGCTGEPTEVSTNWGVHTNVYCPNEATFQFLEDVLTEVIELFPSKYIHIGGDECPKKNWEESQFCQDLIKKEGLKDEHELQSYFIKRMEKFLISKGRQLIGWDEILEGGLAPEATVMSWRGVKGGIEAAKQGHDVIMTPTSHCYFDYYQSKNADEPIAIGGYLPLEKVYNFEPVPDELTKEESKHILGAQGNVWTEYISTPEYAEYMTFPRACALAEVAWSQKDAKNYRDFSNRLDRHIARLRAMDVNVAYHLADTKIQIEAGDGQGVLVNLETEAPSTDIYFTLDGSQPNTTSTLFEEPFLINESGTLKTLAYLTSGSEGRINEQTFNMHLAAGKSIEIAKEPHKRYAAGGKGALINGVQASKERFNNKEWLGYSGENFEATIDLGKEMDLNAVKIQFYNGEGNWIYLPKSMEIFISNDGQDFKSAGKLSNFESDTNTLNAEILLIQTKAKFVKIMVERFGIIPEGAPGEGNEAWLFVGEIEIY